MVDGGKTGKKFVRDVVVNIAAALVLLIAARVSSAWPHAVSKFGGNRTNLG